MAETTVLKPSSVGKMTLFAFPRIGSAILLGIVGFALLLLYSDGYGLNASYTSWVISGGYIAIALSQFFFGWLSDVTYSKKWGARKLYVLILAPIEVIAFIFLLMPSLVLDNPSPSELLIWMAVWNTLFKIAYAVTTPYQAWMAELFSVQDRLKCSQIQNNFNFIGQVIQALFSMLVLTRFTIALKTNPNDIPPLFFWICIIFAVVFVGSFYLSTLLMPTEPRKVEKENMIENLRIILKNRRYQLMVLMAGFASIGWAMAGEVMLKYLTVVLFLGTMEYIICALTLVLVTVIFLRIWRSIIMKLGKTRSIRLVFICGSITMLLSLLGLIYTTMPIIIAVIVVFGYAVTMGGWYLFPYVMYADVAEDDERDTTKMKAGIYVGYPSIILNVCQALSLAILGLFFLLPNVNVGPHSVNLGNIVWGPFASVVLFLVYFYAKRFVNLDYKWEKK
jgi:Na+/melibiose symporter-like transporter